MKKKQLAKFFIPSTLYDNGAGRPGTNSPQTSLRNLVDSEINYINYIWRWIKDISEFNACLY